MRERPRHPTTVRFNRVFADDFRIEGRQIPMPVDGDWFVAAGGVHMPSFQSALKTLPRHARTKWPGGVEATGRAAETHPARPAALVAPTCPPAPLRYQR